MLHNMFVVYDEKAEAYLPPFFFRTVGEALRVFADSANDVTHMFCKHPSDYTIFQLGTFDDGDASCRLLPSAHPLGKAIEFKTSAELRVDRDPLGLTDTKGSV